MARQTKDQRAQEYLERLDEVKKISERLLAQLKRARDAVVFLAIDAEKADRPGNWSNLRDEITETISAAERTL